MGKRFADEELLKGVDERRREFIKKVIVGTAFAVPIMNSFSMDGLKVNMGEAREDSPEPGWGPGPGGPPVSPF